MKKIRNEKGLISVFTMLAMFFFLFVIVGIYTISARRAQTQTQSLEYAKEKYYSEDANAVYNSKLASDEEKIPIYTKEQLWSIGENVGIEIDGKIYDFSQTDLNRYEFQNDIIIDIDTDDLKDVKIAESNGHKVYYYKDNLYYQKTDSEGDLTVDGYHFQLVNKTKNKTLAGLTTGYSYKNPVIPQGFNIVDTDSAKWEYIDESKTEVRGWNEGLVIEDQKGNQFVWVPVDGTTVNYAKWCTDTVSYAACTDATDTATIDEVEYKAIPVDENLQIEKYQGFYVGRYEAGLATETLNQNATLNNIYTEIPVSKAGAKVWNYIDYSHSYVVAQKMINDTKIYGSNKSGLITGTQWDTIMKWYDTAQPKIKVDNTIDWGSYYNIAYTVQPGLYFNSDSATTVWANSPNIINHLSSKGRYYHASGANQGGIKKNIADMAGNFYEWTAEKYTSKCIMRSGQVWHISSNNYPSGRYNDYGSNIASWGVGFRVVLYVE